MKKINLNSRAARKGGVAFAITAIVIAIIICLNMVIGQIPDSYKEFDISDQRIYTVSSIARDYISDLEKDVELVIVAEESGLDARITKYVYNYAELSEHISVVEVDPVAEKALFDSFGCEEDSLVVISPDTGKMTSIALYGYSDAIIQYEMDYNTYSTVESSFDAEGLITSAIEYVTGDASNTVYTLTGHGETALSASATDIVEKSNITVNAGLDLLMDGGIPEDCLLIICNNPASDLANDELTMLTEFLANGGDLLLLMDKSNLTNFNTLMNNYGMAVQPGYLGEYENYYSQYAQYYGNFCIAPTFSGTGITEDIKTNAMLIYPKAIQTTTPVRETISVDSFMTTSSNGLYFADESSDYEVGEFIIGAAASEETDNGTTYFTVVSAASLVDAGITDAASSMSNLDIFRNIVIQGMENVASVVIPAKSLGITYNTFTNYGSWSIIFVLIIPLTCLICGFIVWNRRRKK